ncbi:TPA: UMP kinase, partial [Candidatus Bathyarchaeota archaeon]|nr:UMP kinase [Candidatus Bathyarchaeota archaeon]
MLGHRQASRFETALKSKRSHKRALNVVLKLGGHLIPLTLDADVIARYAEKIRELSRENRVVVVVGGGENARRYIDAARALGADEGVCDIIGIEITRLNARLLISKLGRDAYPVPPTSIDGLRRAFAESRIVVMGGLQPGQSTNAVAALAAEAIGADVLVIGTDVDGVYTE